MTIHSSAVISYIHTRIHTFIHTNHSFIPYIRSIAYAVKCITTLRVVSQSGSCLIQHEQRLTGVRRPAHEGLKAASCQIEPGEKTQICSEADRVILTFSFDPNLEPCPQNLHRGEASRPPKSVSRMTWASARRRVKEQWNAT